MPLKIATVLFFFVMIVLTAPGQLAAQSSDGKRGQVVELEVPAPALAGNLLGTPTTQMAAVYLPPSYGTPSDRRYPSVYLLHGIFDDYGVWLDNIKIAARLDRLISDGKIPEFMVVMPNGGNRYGGGFYRNSPISGAWADYITKDLVTFVDGRFRTLASEHSRAVVGHSMGGYGALHLVMTHPNIFSSVWAMSPCCLAANDDLSFGNDAWKRARNIKTLEDVQQLFDSWDYFPLAALGFATAFSSKAGAPPIYVDFPFDVVRGEVVLRDDAYDQHLDAFPVRRVHDARETLRSLRGIGFGVGLGDQFLHIPTGSLAFSQRLGSQRIPHTLDLYAGDHRQQVGERLENIIFPWIGARLDITN